MKKIFIIFIIVLLVSCDDNKKSNLDSNSTNNSIVTSNNISNSSAIDMNYFNVYYNLIDNDNLLITDSEIIKHEIGNISAKISFLGLSDFSVSSEDNLLIRISLHNDYYSYLPIIQRLIESDDNITFRSQDGTLLAMQEEMLDSKEYVTLIEGEHPYIKLNLSKSGIEKFDNEIIPFVGENNKVIIWLGYDDKTSTVDQFAKFEELQNKAIQYGLDSLSQEERILYKYYSYKILTISTISSFLIESGGLGGVGATSFVLNNNYSYDECLLIVRIINSSKNAYSIKNVLK